jgi:hypothetical protein
VPERTVTFVTGYSTVWQLTGVPINKVCEHVASTKPKFDALTLLANVAANPAAPLVDIAQEVARSTATYIAEHPTDYAPRIGQNLSQSTVARFDPATRRSSIWSFSVDLAADLSVHVSNLKAQEFGPTDDCRMLLFGEVSFLTAAVFNGPGVQFLGERYGRFRNSMTTIQNAEPYPAADFAIDIIEAASRTVTIIPVTGGDRRSCRRSSYRRRSSPALRHPFDVKNRLIEKPDVEGRRPICVVDRLPKRQAKLVMKDSRQP